MTDQITAHRLDEAKQYAEKIKADPEYRKRKEAARSFPSIFTRKKLPFWPLGPKGDVERSFSECCTDSAALAPLMKMRPEIASEIILASLIDGSPEEDYSRRDYLDESLGLTHGNQSYPTAYWKSPFLPFLQQNPDAAIECLIALVNFCTERWSNARDRKRAAKVILPSPLGGQREHFGAQDVFCWSQSNSHESGGLHSALAALERWLCLKLEAGDDILPYVERILTAGSSVAFLGVLVNIGKHSPNILFGSLKSLAGSRHLYVWDEARVEALPYSFSGFEWARQGDLVLKMAQDWHNAAYRKANFQTLVIYRIYSDANLAAYVRAAIAEWALPSDEKRALEARMLAASLDRENQREFNDPETGETKIGIAYPSDIIRDYEAFQSKKAPVQLGLTLPYHCERILGQPAQLTEEQAAALFDTLATVTHEEDLKEEFKQRARISVASTLVVKAPEWLNSKQEAKAEVWGLIRVALDSIDSELKSGHSRYPTGGETLEFVAHAVFSEWAASADDPAASLNVMRVLTSDDSRGVSTLLRLAHQEKAVLGPRWWGLLHFGILWSGLSILRPRHGAAPDVEARWWVWLERLRRRHFSSQEAMIDMIDPAGVANRVQSLERLRWVREFAQGDSYSRIPPEERRSHGLDWSVLEEVFAWLLKDRLEQRKQNSAGGYTDEERRLARALWSYEIWRDRKKKRDRDEDGVPSRLAYKLLELLASMAAETPVDADALWRPVFDLGAAGHYAVGHFLSCWFFESTRCGAVEFERCWKIMIEYALASPEWGKGRPWYYGQKLLRQVLGFGAQDILDRTTGFQDVVFRLRPFYESWVHSHLKTDEDNVAALAVFLASSTGRRLRLDGLQWLNQALSGQDRPMWRRDGAEGALIDLLNTSLTEDAPAVSSNAPARNALLSLVAHLVTHQSPTALALQERARRALR